MEFLQGLWGILAGISTLFPLSNTFLQVVPLAGWPEGGFAYFSPGVVSAVATLICLFVISAWFVMVTRAFVLLGLIEFLGLKE